MIKDTKKLSGRAFILIALYSIVTYLFAHFAYLYMNTDTGVVFEFVSLYISKITEFILPMLIATLALIIYLSNGARAAFVFAIVSSSARVLYTLPYYYIIFIYNYGYDSAESILLSALASIAVTVFTVLGVFLMMLIAMLIIKRIGKRRDPSFSEKESLLSSLRDGQSLSDFSCGANLVLLIFSIFSFVCSIIPEIIDTVSFFIEYGLDYTAVEIVTIMCNYVLLFALIIASYIIAVSIKNSVSKSYLDVSL